MRDGKSLASQDCLSDKDLEISSLEKRTELDVCFLLVARFRKAFQNMVTSYFIFVYYMMPQSSCFIGREVAYGSFK